jgi:hypothetical protein
LGEWPLFAHSRRRRAAFASLKSAERQCPARGIEFGGLPTHEQLNAVNIFKPVHDCGVFN